jgi:hypothetical protein
MQLGCSLLLLFARRMLVLIPPNHLSPIDTLVIGHLHVLVVLDGEIEWRF